MDHVMGDIINNYMIYTLIFRLAVVAVGLVSIVLGYKLFTHESGFSKSSNQEFSASSGNAKLSLKGVGSGSLFSLFGIGLICTMVVTHRPEFVLEEIKNQSQPEETIERNSVSNNYRYRFKGDRSNLDDIAVCLNNYIADIDGSVLDKQTKIENYQKIAESCSNRIFKILFDSFNELALLHIEVGEINKALELARLCSLLYPTDEYYLDTLANIYIVLKEYEKAYVYAKKSVEIAPQITAHKITLKKIESYIESDL